MRLRVAAPRRAIAGVIFAAIGGASLVVSLGYRMGSALHMGPGYYPVMVGLLLVAVGAVALVQALAVSPKAERAAGPRPALRPALLVTLAVLLFAATVDRIGLLAAVFATVLVAAPAARPVRPLESMAVGAVLAGLSALVFIEGLQLPFRLLP